MGQPKTPSSQQRFSPYKRRTPLGIFSRKINGVMSSAVAALGTGLRRSFGRMVSHGYNNKNIENFAALPAELLLQIFDLSSADDLICLATLNHGHMAKVTAYLKSERLASRLGKMLMTTTSMTTTTTNTANGGSYSNFSPSAFARLIQLCHLFPGDQQQLVDEEELREEKRELSIARYIVQLHVKVTNQRQNNDNTTGWQHTTQQFWGQLISLTARHWSQPDFYTLMRMFADALGLHERMERFLYGNNGSDAEGVDKREELALRRLLRPLFLDSSNSTSSSPSVLTPFPGRAQQLHFRLAALLRLFASDEEGLAHRLLLLLGAPISAGNGGDQDQGEHVDYQRIYAEPVLDMASAVAFLGDLPRLAEQLLLTGTLEMEELRWSELEAFNCLEMLTTYPEPWVLRNFASLLVLAPELARVAVYIRALHGDPGDAGNTLFSCVEACTLLRVHPGLLLRDTLNTLNARCPLATRLTILREAIATTFHYTMEILGHNGANAIADVPAAPVNADDVDLVNLRNALDAGRHLSELFHAQIGQQFLR